MSGRVIADGAEDQAPPPRRPGRFLWLLVLAAALIIVFLPGRQPLTGLDDAGSEGEWTLVELPGSGSLTGVTEAADGSYVAVGVGPQFWYSPDGVSWKRGIYPYLRPDWPSGVATLGDNLVAVGRDSIVGGAGVAAVWISTDGINWSESALEAPVPSGLVGITGDGERLVAWGFMGTERAFAPDARNLVMTSRDGRRWEKVHGIPPAARVDAVRHRRGHWYVTGNNVGRPALWLSPDLESWEEIGTRGLPYGWTVTEIVATDPLSVNLVEFGSMAVREWTLTEGEWTQGRGGMTGPFTHAGELGAGWSGLWERQADGSWGRLVIGGREETVTAVAGRVAVGSTRGQPALWIRNPESTPTVDLTLSGSGHWEAQYGVGEGDLIGVWPLGDVWLASVGGEWWLLGPDGAERPPGAPGGPLTLVTRVGNEWLAAPGPWWTTDGRHWEGRTPLPWGAGERSMMAVSGDDSQVTVVGFDERRLWRWAKSVDRGWTWETTSAAATTPLRQVAGFVDGFVAVAAQERNRAALVQSRDGFVWEPAETPGRLLPLPLGPAVVWGENTVEFLDTGLTVTVPHTDITAAVPTDDGLVLIANRTMWIGPDDWRPVPLDPAHGLSAGRVHPIVLDGQLHVVASDRGRVVVYRWEP